MSHYVSRCLAMSHCGLLRLTTVCYGFTPRSYTKRHSLLIYYISALYLEQSTSSHSIKEHPQFVQLCSTEDVDQGSTLSNWSPFHSKSPVPASTSDVVNEQSSDYVFPSQGAGEPSSGELIDQPTQTMQQPHDEEVVQAAGSSDAGTGHAAGDE